MTRSKHILALLVSLVALAVLAPAASAATSPNPYRYADPNGVRYGSSVDPSSLVSSIGVDRRRFHGPGIGADRRKFHARGIGPKAIKPRI